jgi:hypothetical protein
MHIQFWLDRHFRSAIVAYVILSMGLYAALLWM